MSARSLPPAPPAVAPGTPVRIRDASAPFPGALGVVLGIAGEHVLVRVDDEREPAPISVRRSALDVDGVHSVDLWSEA
jgi:hypothetical protein